MTHNDTNNPTPTPTDPLNTEDDYMAHVSSLFRAITITEEDDLCLDTACANLKRFGMQLNLELRANIIGTAGSMLECDDLVTLRSVLLLTLASLLSLSQDDLPQLAQLKERQARIMQREAEAKARAKARAKVHKGTQP